MKEPQKLEPFPDEAVYRILYSSSVPRMRSAAEVETDIEHILRDSRLHNLARGITGVLVTNKRMYSQIIEGPKPVVKDLMGHIVCDYRHNNVRIVSNHRVERRIFEDWFYGICADKSGFGNGDLSVSI